jgi:signal peptidase I
MKTHTHQPPLRVLFSLFAALIFWLALAPTQLGGQVTYVIVNGNSMEPKFHFGDLVLVRRQAAYQIGDAVTYQNAELGRFVFHRIVGIQVDHFILRGDHNTWLDGYHPGQGEIIGKLWVHIPALGKAIQWARDPFHLAIGCGLFGGMMAASIILNPSQRGKRKNKNSTGHGGLLEGGLYLTGFLVLGLLALTIFAFTRPLTRPVENIQYQQDGYFTYSAAGTPGIYDTNTIRPGEPIFPKLTCFLNVGLVYTMTGGGSQQIVGSHQLYARVLDEKSGWQRTIPLEAETSFSGNSYASRADLDLCRIEEMVASVEEQTGLHPSIYTLQVIAQTTITGSIDGQPVVDSLTPSLLFKFDEVHFHLDAKSDQEDPLRTTKSGIINGTEQKPSILTMFGREISIQTLRVLTLFGLAIALASLLLVSLYFFKSALTRKNDMIRLKYRGLLMDVHGISYKQDLPVIDVASMDDLAKLAERQSTMITHLVLNYLHYYMVQSNGVMYRYVISARQHTARKDSTLPKLIPAYQTQKDYLEANPVDEAQYGYRVDLNQNEHAVPNEYQTVFLNKVRL